MLDVQRSRGAKHREEIDFTRKLMWGHMILGAVVITLFLFHELFWWFAGALVWYAVSLVVMYGFMGQRPRWRWLLALVFLSATAIGLYFVNRVYPGLTPPPRGTLMPQALIPLWGGFANLAYGIGALLMIFNGSVRRAGQEGFTLW